MGSEIKMLYGLLRRQITGYHDGLAMLWRYDSSFPHDLLTLENTQVIRFQQLGILACTMLPYLDTMLPYLDTMLPYLDNIWQRKCYWMKLHFSKYVLEFIKNSLLFCTVTS